MQTFQEMNALQSVDLDLTSDLHQLLNRLQQSGLEVIVVDQTVPLIEKRITLCKSHYSGHATDDIWSPSHSTYRADRVYTVPMTLGYTDEPLTTEQLNPHPHPFP